MNLKFAFFIWKLIYWHILQKRYYELNKITQKYKLMKKEELTKEQKTLALRIESASAVILLLGKVLLTGGYPLAWGLSLVGYVLATWSNDIRKYAVLKVLTASLVVLSGYGIYRSYFDIKGLQIFDGGVVVITAFICIYIAHQIAKEKKPLWFLQILAATFALSSWIVLGLGIHEGWWLLLAGHIALGILYSKPPNPSYPYMGLQAISAIIAIYALNHINLIKLLLDQFWSKNHGCRLPVIRGRQFFFIQRSLIVKSVYFTTKRWFT